MFSSPCMKEYSVRWILAALFFCVSIDAALAQSDWKKDWERALLDASKEGKIVVGIPARPELRKQLEAYF